MRECMGQKGLVYVEEGCRSQDCEAENRAGRPLKPLQGVRTFSLRVIGNHEGCVGSNAMDRFTFGADLSSCGLDDKQQWSKTGGRDTGGEAGRMGI